MREGIFSDIPAEEYHSIPAVSNSYLQRLNRVPAAAKIEQEDTGTLLFGRAFHCLLLEGEEAFYSLFAVAPDRASTV